MATRPVRVDDERADDSREKGRGSRRCATCARCGARLRKSLGAETVLDEDPAAVAALGQREGPTDRSLIAFAKLAVTLATSRKLGVPSLR